MFEKELTYINERSIQLDREMPELKSSMMSDNLQAGTLGSLAKAWNMTTEQTARIIALMMVLVIDPLAIVMLMVGNFLQMKGKVKVAEKSKQPVYEEKFIEHPHQEIIAETVLTSINGHIQTFHETADKSVVENDESLQDEKKVKTLRDYIANKSGIAQ